MEIYTVRPGDTLASIAAATGVPAGAIIYDNQLLTSADLLVGQALLLDSQENCVGARMPKRRIAATGYVYTYVEEEILSETLPFLSELAIFSYGFSLEGNLIPPNGDDRWIIEQAGRYAVLPLLTLTPFDAEGKFNDYLITTLVNDETVKAHLIAQLLQVVQEKGYGGVNIDFEYISGDDKEAYTLFVSDVTNTLNRYGYQVSVALAPKTSDEQRSVLVSGIDYQALGEAANYVYLMTYEWGYTFGENMAVSPFDKVRAVLDYAVTRIPPEKISLGISNYGYDWPLPYVRNETRATSLGTIEALAIAGKYDSVIQFDFTSVAPFFNYTAEGAKHEVWFEDVRSLQARYSLIEEYGLRGCFYWQNMRLYRAGLQLLAAMYWINKNK